MQYKYTEPFKVLKKLVDITNESSLKVLENAEVAENIFEPIITIEKTMQSELVEAVHSEVREAWDDFRTSNWINIIRYPESFIQQGVQLLSVVNVQY